MQTRALIGLVLIAAALCGCDAQPEPAASTPVLATAQPQPMPVPLQSPLQSPIAAATATPIVGNVVPTYTYKIVNVYPHDVTAFTEGLVFSNGRLFESTGLNGRSTLREVELATGKVLRTRSLDQQYFGEGLAQVGDRLIQLTWQTQVGFVYDEKTFEPLRTFTYTYEGWGLAYNGQELALSDGTPTLRFLDPQTLTTTRQVQVTDHGKPVTMLNELEWVNGEIFANVWQTDLIARIDPHTGFVAGWIDLSRLISEADRAEAQKQNREINVLNGIAYDAAQDRLFVTGKLWPKLFEIKLIKR